MHITLLHTRHAYQNRVSWPSAFVALLLLMAPANKALTSHPEITAAVDLEFRLAEGPGVSPVSAGAIWLYYYGWGTLDSLKLADIGQEPVRIVLTPEWRDSMIPPESQTDACVVAIELPGPIWYRTADVSRADLLRDFEANFWALGSRIEDPSGSLTFVLPEHPLRLLRFLDPEDKAVAAKRVKISIYLTDRNHCGYHHGLPLGTFRTDERGEISLPSPLVELYLDGLRYFEDVGDGPWGRKFSGCEGLRLGPKPVEVIKKAWELPAVDVWVQVRDSAGNPAREMLLGHCVRTSECGCNCGTAGETDARGVIHASLKPGETEEIWLARVSGDSQKDRPLTDAEIRELFEKGILTIRLPAP